MSPSANSLVTVAGELARAFDGGFAQPVATGANDDAVEDLLGLRLAGEDYVVRLAEVAGLLPAQRIVSLPGPRPELLGLIGLRGELVPVYGLASLLGHPRTATTAAWVLLVRGGTPLGLAFDHYTGHARVPRDQLVAAEGDARAHVARTVRIGGVLRNVIDLGSMAASIAARSAGADQKG